MPFRTRDFLLFMLTVAFLLIGITSTVKSDIANRSQEASVINFASSDKEVIYQAVLPEPKIDARPSRLAELREKIAGLVLTKTEEPEAEVVPVDEIVEEVTEEVAPGTISQCSNYTTINPNWSPSNLLFEIVEGARIVYRNVVINQIVGSSTTNISSREVVLQLPLRTFPLPEKTCLGTDVVGVALDGSLIRNSEDALYKVFGGETLIGYALDGFPIYGQSGEKTDECGGSAVSGEYRYYLSSEREGILGCFGGIPTSF
jgi:hypothetical protein